jgi:hypothetical protein
MTGNKKLDAYYWGGVLLWAGLMFGAESMGILPQIGNANAWSYVFLGAGLFAIAFNVFRISSGTHTRPSTWDWIWGVVLTVLGLSGFTALPVSWPLIIILVGVVILGNAFFDRG